MVLIKRPHISRLLDVLFHLTSNNESSLVCGSAFICWRLEIKCELLVYWCNFINVRILFFYVVYSIPLDSPPRPPVVITPREVHQESEWALVPDAEGNFHLVDVKAEAAAEADTFFEAERDVVFRLFTHTVSNRVVQLDNPGSLTGSSFNPGHPTRFVIHGWNGDGNSGINNAIRTAYLARGNFNVFVVDWGLGANANYVTSRNRVGAVGAALARFIIFLHQQTGMTFGSVTVVGHSLGAHIAGLAGKNTQGSGRLGVIVGLDAAFPLFSVDQPAQRLHNSDADYVESIHTNAGLLGFDQPLGDASFYPNFGRSQVIYLIIFTIYLLYLMDVCRSFFFTFKYLFIQK